MKMNSSVIICLLLLLVACILSLGHTREKAFQTTSASIHTIRELTHITFQGPLPEGCAVLDFTHDFESVPAVLVDVIQCTDFCGPGKYVNLTLTSVCTTLDVEGCVNTVDCIVPGCNEDCDAEAGECDCTDKFLLDADGNLAVDEGLCDELCAAEQADMVTLAPTVAPTSSPVSVVAPTLSPTSAPVEDVAPTESPVAVDSPAVSDIDCFSNTTLLAEAITTLDTTMHTTFKLCPNTLIRISDLALDEDYCSDDNYMAPLFLRSNVTIQCGDDGSSSNNCTLQGGKTQVTSLPDIFGQNTSNASVYGVTFKAATEMGALLANAGDVSFVDCVFKDHVNFGAVSMAWSPAPETEGLTLEDLEPGSYWNQVLEVIENVRAFTDQFRFRRSICKRKLSTQKMKNSSSSSRENRELTHITFQGPLPEGCAVLDFTHDFESVPAVLVDVVQCTDFCGPGKYVNLTLTSVCTTLDEEGCVNTVDCIGPGCNEDCDAEAGECDCTDKFLLDADGNLAVDEGLCDELCAAEPADVVTLAPTVAPTSSPVSVMVPTIAPPEMEEQKYAFCGDCHCINGDEPCPAGDQIPQMDFSSVTIAFFRSLTVDNPYEIFCDPYKDDACQTTPPQTSTDLGDAAACAVKYDTRSLSFDQCPTSYSLVTYAFVEEAQTDGATLTHHGACGVCSTTQDLAVYIEYTDLTEKGIECSLRALRDFEDGVACYEEVGYTRPCAIMWVYNGFNTRANCLEVCSRFNLSGEPNNGPPPNCTIADCLLCDEEESGPLFQKIAARSRRRSGLLSRIARPCDQILLVEHTIPCDFALLPDEPTTDSPIAVASPTVSPDSFPTEEGRQKVAFRNCTFLSNQPLSSDNLPKAVLLAETAFNDLLIEDCYFSNNDFGLADGVGAAVLIQTGSTIHISGTCFVSNDFKGPGTVVVVGSDQDMILFEEGSNNFGTQDDGLACEFIALVSSLGEVPFLCVDFDAEQCSFLSPADPTVAPTALRPPTSASLTVAPSAERPETPAVLPSTVSPIVQSPAAPTISPSTAATIAQTEIFSPLTEASAAQMEGATTDSPPLFGFCTLCSPDREISLPNTIVEIPEGTVADRLMFVSCDELDRAISSNLDQATELCDYIQQSFAEQCGCLRVGSTNGELSSSNPSCRQLSKHVLIFGTVSVAFLVV